MLYNPYKRIKQLEETNQFLSQQYQNLLQTKISPETVIANILQRGIAWYNYEELDMAGRNEYHSNIQSVIRNEAYQNEVNHYIADIVQEIAKKSKDFGEVRDLRMIINAMEALKERMESVTKYERDESTDEIYEAL